MKRYALLRNNYVVEVSYGENPGNDWVEYPDDAPDLGMYRVRRINNKFVTEELNFDSLLKYDLKRASNYPPIGDQLDALWKAIEPLITHPEARAILDKIQEIKSTYPKT